MSIKRNEILIEFWESKEVNDAISKMHPAELRDDLKSEVFLILSEIDEIKLIDLYDRKILKFYVVRIMLNLVQSTDKKFYKKYRDFVEYNYDKDEVQDDSYTTDEIVIIENVNSAIENLYWYDKELLRLYTFVFNKNARELSRQTGIPYMSIIRTLNQIKKHLKQKIKNGK